jgi:FeS assembly SUF system regulator
MIRITNFADYALVVMMHAARQTGFAARLNAPSVAAATGIPMPTVAKIMGQLGRAGLLASQRGVGGGFELVRPLNELSVAAIIEAVDGPIALTQCVSHDGDHSSECSYEPTCAMRPHWQVINGTVRDALAGVTLDQLMAQPAPALPAWAMVGA